MKSLPPESDAAMPLLRVGLLGCSDIASRRFLPALDRSRRAILAGLASRSPERATALASGAGVRIMTYDDLVAAPDIDLVYLSLPNHLHEEWGIRLLEAGKHLICEKPLALSPVGVERMVATAESHGRLLYENLMFLHHPQHQVVASLLAGGAIGRLAVLRATFCFPGPAPGDFRLDPDQGGGALHDLARYPLGIALRFLTGLPRRFRGQTIRQGGLVRSLCGTAISPAGELFSYAVAFGQQYESWYELVGETGRIRVDRAFTPPADLANRIRVLAGGDEREVVAPACDQFQQMIDDVADLVGSPERYAEPHERSRVLAGLAREMEEGGDD
jgi:predicted dehydrogenase